jgi:hypothetical protein
MFEFIIITSIAKTEAYPFHPDYPVVQHRPRCVLSFHWVLPACITLYHTCASNLLTYSPPPPKKVVLPINSLVCPAEVPSTSHTLPIILLKRSNKNISFTNWFCTFWICCKMDASQNESSTIPNRMPRNTPF